MTDKKFAELLYFTCLRRNPQLIDLHQNVHGCCPLVVTFIDFCVCLTTHSTADGSFFGVL